VGHSGTAYLCTSDHVPIYFEGMTHTPEPVHVDVSMKLWNKTHRAMTIFEPKRARATGQDLRWDEPNYIGWFNEATLSSDGSTAEQHFRLRPPGASSWSRHRRSAHTRPPAQPREAGTGAPQDRDRTVTTDDARVAVELPWA
jgi:hypothetical protein